MLSFLLLLRSAHSSDQVALGTLHSAGAQVGLPCLGSVRDWLLPAVLRGGQLGRRSFSPWRSVQQADDPPVLLAKVRALVLSQHGCLDSRPLLHLSPAWDMSERSVSLPAMTSCELPCSSSCRLPDLTTLSSLLDDDDDDDDDDDENLNV